MVLLAQFVAGNLSVVFDVDITATTRNILTEVIPCVLCITIDWNLDHEIIPDDVVNIFITHVHYIHSQALYKGAENVLYV